MIEAGQEPFSEAPWFQAGLGGGIWGAFPDAKKFIIN